MPPVTDCEADAVLSSVIVDESVNVVVVVGGRVTEPVGVIDADPVSERDVVTVWDTVPDPVTVSEMVTSLVRVISCVSENVIVDVGVGGGVIVALSDADSVSDTVVL